MKQHCDNEYHKHAAFDLENCVARFESSKQTVPYLVDAELKSRQEKYHHILTKIAQAVHFCGRQGIPFRGHREDILPSEAGNNPGNFIAYLRDLAKEDKILMEHLSAPLAKNVTYLRPQSQNEMIQTIGIDMIQAAIIEEMKSAGVHGIMADEVTSDNAEIVSLCFRFVDSKDNVREEFLEFVDVSRITGVKIAETIVQFYKVKGLDIKLLRSQCYDGAANMSSEKKGVAAMISRHSSSSPYIHCHSHVLNLSIANSCKNIHVQHVIATVKDISIFFKVSPLRENLLEAVAEKRSVHPSTRKVLKGMCKTRWAERDSCYEHFCLALPFLVESLEIINGSSPKLSDYSDEYTKGWSSQAKREATPRLKALTDFSFIVGLITMYHLLHPLHGITVLLQGRNMDIVRAYQEVDSTLSDLKHIRSTVEDEFRKIYLYAIRVAENIGVDPSFPRTTGRQQHRPNTPAANPEEYFRRTIAVPLLDSIISEMEVRFDATSKRAVKLLCLVPVVCCRSDECPDISDAVDMFAADIPHPALVGIEFQSWRRKWMAHLEEERPRSLASAIKKCQKDMYPNLHILMKVACTFGVTSCECERSFSTLRRLNTYLRKTMETERLSALALMNIHYGFGINYGLAATKFLQLHPRKIQTSNLLFEK